MSGWQGHPAILGRDIWNHMPTVGKILTSYENIFQAVTNMLIYLGERACEVTNQRAGFNCLKDSLCTLVTFWICIFGSWPCHLMYIHIISIKCSKTADIAFHTHVKFNLSQNKSMWVFFRFTLFSFPYFCHEVKLFSPILPHFYLQIEYAMSL